MILFLLFKGIAIGLAIAAPVGPVAILCIRRTLLYGAQAGLASGLGAVIADVVFGTVAAFGVAALTDTLMHYETGLRLVGGLFMLGLGVSAWRKPPPKSRDVKPNDNGRLFQAFASALALTITNPITIFAFTAIFAGFGVVSDRMSSADSGTLILGVAIGACLWWSGLTLVACWLRRRVPLDQLSGLNRVSGGVIIVFGLVALASLAM